MRKTKQFCIAPPGETTGQSQIDMCITQASALAAPLTSVAEVFDRPLTT